MSTAQHEIVDRYFAAMRRGAEGEDDLLALFADDAVYVEPFGGTPRTSTGKAAIRAALRAGWETPMPDLRLTVDRVDVTGGTARSWWTCESSAFPHPMKGTDTYVIDGGLIQKLVVELLN